MPQMNVSKALLAVTEEAYQQSILEDLDLDLAGEKVLQGVPLSAHHPLPVPAQEVLQGVPLFPLPHKHIWEYITQFPIPPAVQQVLPINTLLELYTLSIPSDTLLNPFTIGKLTLVNHMLSFIRYHFFRGHVQQTLLRPYIAELQRELDGTSAELLSQKLDDIFFRLVNNFYLPNAVPLENQAVIFSPLENQFPFFFVIIIIIILAFIFLLLCWYIKNKKRKNEKCQDSKQEERCERNSLES